MTRRAWIIQLLLRDVQARCDNNLRVFQNLLCIFWVICQAFYGYLLSGPYEVFCLIRTCSILLDHVGATSPVQVLLLSTLVCLERSLCDCKFGRYFLRTLCRRLILLCKRFHFYGACHKFDTTQRSSFQPSCSACTMSCLRNVRRFLTLDLCLKHTYRLSDILFVCVGFWLRVRPMNQAWQSTLFFIFRTLDLVNF